MGTLWEQYMAITSLWFTSPNILVAANTRYWSWRTEKNHKQTYHSEEIRVYFLRCNNRVPRCIV
jgi:hypothetical protein